jgi:hypothetical protein
MHNQSITIRGRVTNCEEFGEPILKSIGGKTKHMFSQGWSGGGGEIHAVSTNRRAAAVKTILI